MSLEHVAEATGVSPVFLGAMERDDFASLPGRAFGKLYIRAYAEVLDFDPRPLIDDYDRATRAERSAAAEGTKPAPAGSRPVAEAIARWKSARTGAAPAAPAGPAAEPVTDAEPEASHAEPAVAAATEGAPIPPSPIPPGPIPPARSSPRRVALLIAVSVIVVAAVVTTTRRPPAPALGPAPAPEPASVPQATPPPALEAPPASGPSTADAPPSTLPADPPARAGEISVVESGLGRRVVASRLEGAGDRFSAGEIAVFQTRVIGGARGQTVRHVWIFEGRAQQSITLRLGGPDWRTHSSKTLLHPGAWTVEARDGAGRVLAKASLECVPR